MDLDDSYKEYCLDKYRAKSPFELINRKLLIHKQLEKPPRTYVVYSDLHGSYEKFLHWLKNGLGYYRIAVNNTLGESYSKPITECYEQLLLIINRRRFEAIEEFIQSSSEEFDNRAHFFDPVPHEFNLVLDHLEDFGLTKRRILLDCLRLLQDITKGDERRIIKMVPHQYLENILQLYHQTDAESFEGLVQGICGQSVIYSFMMSLVVRLVVFNMFDKHINLGDTFDRGDGADQLIKLYRTFFGDMGSESPLHYIWGNHDILWLGAGIGNPILCVEALRVSIRYNNTEFLARYGFQLKALEDFAFETYHLRPSGSYAKTKGLSDQDQDRVIKVAKALLVLQLKLTLLNLREAVKIPGEIDYQPELERHEALLKLLILPTNAKEDETAWAEFMAQNPLYRDCYFPTIDPEDPARLTAREQQVVLDIVSQFNRLPKLQKDLQWMFEKGETYRVVDNTLYFHAALPATEDHQLVSVKGRQGKELLDFIQKDLKRISRSYQNSETISLREQMLLWHLWSGKESPFFCKEKMATLERAVFHKEAAEADPLTTHREVANPYYKNIRDDHFLSKVLYDFHAEKICMGHTPVKTMRQAVLSDSIRAFIIDGGAASAYGDRGAVLINTPDYAYLTMHPGLKELIDAEKANRLPDIQVHRMEERGRLRLRHMEKGYFLERELEAIDQLLSTELDRFKTKYFY